MATEQTITPEDVDQVVNDPEGFDARTLLAFRIFEALSAYGLQPNGKQNGPLDAGAALMYAEALAWLRDAAHAKA